MRRAQEIELLQEVVLNSPLLRRKLLTNQSEEKEKKKKGIRKLLSGMVSSFRNVITGAIPTSTSKENSIPLVEFVTTRGLGGMPKAKSVGYAKLALAEQLKKDEVIVEVCEKATETTPSLLDFQDEELDEDFYLANDFDEVDYFYHDEEDEEDEFSCVVCERAFFTAKQLERHQYRKKHWGCRVCEERFPSLVLLEYHKEDEDHWSYLSEDDDYEDCKKRDFEAKREIMNDRNEDETEFGPDEEDKEMLVTSVGQ